MSSNNKINLLREEFLDTINDKDYFSAIDIGQKILAMYDKDETSYEYCIDLYNIAFINQALSKFSLCTSYYKKILKIIDKNNCNIKDKKNINIINLLIDTENALGVCYGKSLSKASFSISHFERCVELLEKHLPNDKKRLANMYHNLGCVHNDIEDFDISLSYHKKELALREDRDIDYIDTLNYLGYGYEDIKDYKNSIYHLLEALDIITNLYGTNSQEYISNLYYISSVYFKASMFDEAIKRYEKCYILMVQRMGKHHPYISDVLTKLSQCHIKNNDTGLALLTQTNSLNLIKESLGTEHLQYANDLKKIAEIHYIAGDYEKSIPFYEEENTIKKNIIGIYNNDYINNLLNLTNVYIKTKEMKKEEDIYYALINMIDFDLSKALYTRAISVLCKIYISNKCSEKLNRLYEDIISSNIFSSFDDLLSKSETVVENIVNLDNKINDLCMIYYNDSIEEDNSMLDSLKSMFEVFKKEIEEDMDNNAYDDYDDKNEYDDYNEEEDN